MGTPKWFWAFYGCWIGGALVFAILNQGCGTSQCSLQSDQLARMQRAEETARLIAHLPQSFPKDYQQRAQTQLEKLKELKKPFACSQEQQVVKELNSIDVNVRLLADAALPSCLNEAGKLLHRLDSVADHMNDEERDEYKTERSVDPSKLAQLNGCIERVRKRAKLLQDVEKRLRKLPSFPTKVKDKVNSFRKLARTSWWEQMRPEKLEERYNNVMALTGQLPQAESQKLRQVLANAHKNATQGYESYKTSLRKAIGKAIETCDRQAFQDALADFKKLPEAASKISDLDYTFNNECNLHLEVNQIVDRIKEASNKLQDGLASHDIARQDRAIAAFSKVVADIPPSNSAKGRVLAKKGVDYQVLDELLTLFRHILAADAAVNTAHWDRARVELNQANKSQVERGMHLVPLRLARVDRRQALAMGEEGRFDQAWGLLLRAAKLLNVGQDQARIALDALAAARGDRAVLMWAHRADAVKALRYASRRALSAVVEASSRSGNDDALGLAALKFLVAQSGAISRTTIVAAANLLYQMTKAGRMSGSTAQPYLLRLINTALAAGSIRESAAAGLENLLVFDEIAESIRDGVDAVVGELPEVSQLSAKRRRRLEEAVLDRLFQEVSSSSLIVAVRRNPETMAGLFRSLALKATGNGGLAMDHGGHRIGLMISSSAGPLLIVLQLPHSGGSNHSQVEARVRTVEAEALGIIAAVRMRIISDQVSRSVKVRKQRVAELIDGIRRRMGGVVLVYAGLFNRSGRLEVPQNAHDFFLVPELRGQPDPVFEDSVSRKAMTTGGVQRQFTRIGRYRIEDLAVAITRGRNRVGVLRLGVYVNR